jgi:hypothetical protein
MQKILSLKSLANFGHSLPEVGSWKVMCTLYSSQIIFSCICLYPLMQENHMAIDNVPDNTAEDSGILQVNLRIEFILSSTLSRTARKSCIFLLLIMTVLRLDDG